MAVLEQVPDALKELEGQGAGQTRVKAVRVEERDDSSGQRALYIVLVLSDPPAGQDTWPVDDLWALRSRVRAAVATSESITEPWFVMFEPEHPGELDSGDLSEQLDADG
jgi:hypothetical protein